MAPHVARSTVMFRTSDVLAVHADDIAALKKAAQADPMGRARLCLHSGHDEPVQQMVIAVAAGKPVAPHRQREGRKTYVALDGRLQVRLFDAAGQGGETYILEGADKSVLNFAATGWHACEALSPVAVYLEVVPGPFDPRNTEWWPGDAVAEKGAR